MHAQTHAHAHECTRTPERRRKFHDRCGSQRFQQLPVFSKRISKKSKTKDKSLKKIFFSGKKKTKSFAIDRERASSEISVECSYGIFFSFLKSDEKEIRDARARERAVKILVK